MVGAFLWSIVTAPFRSRKPVARTAPAKRIAFDQYGPLDPREAKAIDERARLLLDIEKLRQM